MIWIHDDFEYRIIASMYIPYLGIIQGSFCISTAFLAIDFNKAIEDRRSLHGYMWEFFVCHIVLLYILMLYL